MNYPHLFPAVAVLIAALAISHAQRPGRGRGAKPKAEQRTAVESIAAARKASSKEVAYIVEMRGDHGMPDPDGWTIRFYDAASRTYLSYLEPGERAAPADNDYADGRAPVYFEAARVKLDSPEAFKAANKEAEAAKVGFDSVDFQLRGREFSGEPIWTLRLLNTEEELVGMIDLSAETGKTLRTIWLRRDPDSGVMKVIDSALTPGGPGAAADGAANSTEKEPKALPPIQNIDPPPPPSQ